jgi:hypothetical protein
MRWCSGKRTKRIVSKYVRLSCVCLHAIRDNCFTSGYLWYVLCLWICKPRCAPSGGEKGPVLLAVNKLVSAAEEEIKKPEPEEEEEEEDDDDDLQANQNRDP